MIPYGRQSISDADIQAVVDVLHSDFLTQGPVVPAFEKSVAGYAGAAYAIAVNSATSALHIACLSLGVGPGDRVWTSPITFVASANCALYCGAQVDFVDIDPHTYNLSPSALAQKLEQAGVHVVYGLLGLKTHSKIAMVIRREGEGIRRYIHWPPVTIMWSPRASTRILGCLPATRPSAPTPLTCSTT